APRALLADLTPAPVGTPALLRRLASHASGLRVVSQDGQLDGLSGIDAEAVRELLIALDSHFDAVVVDGLRDFRALPLAALDASARVLLVVTPDVAALRRAGRCRQVMRRLDIADERLRLIVNRHRKRAMARALIEQAALLPVAATIANDFPTVASAL